MNESSGTLTDSDDVHPWGRWDDYYTEKLGIQTSDRVLGSVFIFCTLVGLLGNGSAVCYFWQRRQKTIHDLQYLAITTVDFFTVSSSFPIIASLLNNRYPMLFRNDVFCTAWSSVVIFTARMSMFLAMMISITRTIAMKCPHRPIKRSWVISVITGYAAYMIVIYSIFLPQRWQYGTYLTKLSSCFMIIINKEIPEIAEYFGMISYILELFLPSVITLACFVVGIRVLMTRPTVGDEHDKKFRRASVTITIFTAVFLACNTPCFLCQMWEILSFLNNLTGPDQTQYHNFRYYARLLLQIFPIFLNATINPLLYLSRMRGFQDWISKALRSQTSQTSQR